MILNRVQELIELSEAASMPNYGAPMQYKDTTPGISLREAAGNLPCIILESQLEFLDDVDKHNEAVVEAVINAISLQESVNLYPLVEASSDALTARIKSVFDRIIKAIRDILAKLKTRYDTMVKTGQELITAYQNKLGNMANDHFKGMTVTGYSFPKVTFNAPSAVINDRVICDIVGIDMGPKEFANKYRSVTPDTDDASEVQSIYRQFENISDDSIKTAVVKKMVSGAHISESDVQKSLTESVFGQKKEFSYGDGPFTKEWIVSAIKDRGEVADIKKAYESLIDALENYQDELIESASKIKAPDNYSSGERTKAIAAEAANGYYNKFIKAVTSVTEATSMVMSVRVNAMYTKYAQASEWLRKMLVYNSKAAEKKAKNEDSDLIDDWDMTDFSFDD